TSGTVPETPGGSHCHRARGAAAQTPAHVGRARAAPPQPRPTRPPGRAPHPTPARPGSTTKEERGDTMVHRKPGPSPGPRLLAAIVICALAIAATAASLTKIT